MGFFEFISIYHIDFYIRAIVVTMFSLFLYKFGNSRLFSQLAAYDLLIFIILGALLGTAIINKDLFVSSLVCCLIITSIHRFFGYLSLVHKPTNNLLKGNAIVLYENKRWVKENLRKNCLNKGDIYQELRNSQGIDNVDTIRKIIMERNGKISFLRDLEILNS